MSNLQLPSKTGGPEALKRACLANPLPAHAITGPSPAEIMAKLERIEGLLQDVVRYHQHTLLFREPNPDYVSIPAPKHPPFSPPPWEIPGG